MKNFIEITVHWDVIPCSLVKKKYEPCEGNCSLDRQGVKTERRGGNREEVLM
jgi:hypothetical protein